MSICFGTVMHPTSVWTFSITSPVEGEVVEAGSTIEVRVDRGDAGVLVGVLFGVAARGIGGDFDVLPPYKWTVKIPENYVGPLTFNAVGRVFGQKTGEPPQARVTVMVTLPSNVTLQGIRVRNDQKLLFLRAGLRRTDPRP